MQKQTGWRFTVSIAYNALNTLTGVKSVLSRLR